MRPLVMLAVAALGACAPPGASDETMEAKNAALAADEALEEAAEALTNAGAVEATAASEGWVYTSDSDPMSDEKTELACVQSSNTIRLSFPYGETGARLCLRNSPQFGRDAFVSLNEDGQILCRSYESCTIRIRFDKTPAESWSAIGPSDNSTDVVFIQNRSALERLLRTAETTHVQLEFFQNGMQTFTFNTADLKWPKNSQ